MLVLFACVTRAVVIGHFFDGPLVFGVCGAASLLGALLAGCSVLACCLLCHCHDIAVSRTVAPGTSNRVQKNRSLRCGAQSHVSPSRTQDQDKLREMNKQIVVGQFRVVPCGHKKHECLYSVLVKHAHEAKSTHCFWARPYFSLAKEKAATRQHHARR